MNDYKLTFYLKASDSDHPEELMQQLIEEIKQREGADFVHASCGMYDPAKTE